MASYNVATATVTIVPTMKGAQEKIADGLGVEKAGESSGKKLGSSLAGALKGAVAAAAIGEFIKSSLDAGADLQQSFGGLETIYGESAEAMKEYANQAYKMGMSANDYAETAVGMGAALKAAFGGDTNKAMEAANMAIEDMTDNAAKMGTPIESIQNAYAGFAKGQYNMLDNLKLGYGGTKEEMERLLADASELSGVEYNIDNLGDVYDAIHVIQGELGLAGVAAAEAEGTFSGSFNSMKSAATNFLASLSLGEGVSESFANLASTAQTFLVDNLLPMVGNIVSQIPSVLAQLPGIVADLLPQLLPALGEVLSGLVRGIIDAIPQFIAGIQELAQSAFDAFLNIDWGAAGALVVELFGAAWNGLLDIAAGIWDGIAAIFTGEIDVAAIVTSAWDKLSGVASKVFDAAKKVFEGAAPKVKAIVTKAWDTVSTTASTIWDGVKEIFSSFDIEWPDFGELASAAFEGLKNAAKSAWDWVKGLFGGGANDETVKAVEGSTEEMAAALEQCNLVVSDVDTSALDTANDYFTETTGEWETSLSDMELTVPDLETGALDVALSEVESAASAMQSAMNFDWTIPQPHGTLPTISVSMGSATSSDGKTTASYPIFSVSTRWYATGGIFQQPTVIGVGEAGAEAALPLDQFWNRLDDEFESNGSGATINNYIEINGANDPVLYADELARELQQQLKRA